MLEGLCLYTDRHIRVTFCLELRRNHTTTRARHRKRGTTEHRSNLDSNPALSASTSWTLTQKRRTSPRQVFASVAHNHQVEEQAHSVGRGMRGAGGGDSLEILVVEVLFED